MNNKKPNTPFKKRRSMKKAKRSFCRKFAEFRSSLVFIDFLSQSPSLGSLGPRQVSDLTKASRVRKEHNRYFVSFYRVACAQCFLARVLVNGLIQSQSNADVRRWETCSRQSHCPEKHLRCTLRRYECFRRTSALLSTSPMLRKLLGKNYFFKITHSVRNN